MGINQPIQPKYRILFTSSVILGAIAVTLFLMGFGTYRTEVPCEATYCLEITTINFSPQDGSWNLNWHGGNLTYANAEHYVVNIQLKDPAPITFSREFLIREDKFWGDATLGVLTATFSTGSQTAAISYLRQCCGATKYPTGAPSTLSDGTIWMGCTKKGYVKANGQKGDDSHAKIYLEKVQKADSVGVKKKYSPKYDVTCT